MYPVLKDNHIFLYYNEPRYIARFNIVVLEDNNDQLVKRVIGLPNDAIYLQHGKVVAVNDKVFADALIDNSKVTKITVPPMTYFYIGDNQSNSVDSRHLGTIKKENIKGKVVWSL